jgi:hypothetical protein
MRAPVQKHLVATFRREFEKRYTQFSLHKISEGGFKVWEWQLAPDLRFFVVLSIFNRYAQDAFAIELAWNEENAFPWTSIGDPLSLGAQRWRGRLGRLWKTGGDEPVWDAAPEVKTAIAADFDAIRRGGAHSSALPIPPVDVVIPRIAPLVDDALQKFEEYGVPFFKQVARHRGLEGGP